MIISNLQKEATSYINSFRSFLIENSLSELLIPPVDHLAIKMKDAKEFEDLLLKINPLSSHISYTYMNNRKIAVAELINPISFGELGETNILEIMEPKPEKSGKDLVGFEHIEIYHPQFDEIEVELKAKNIAYEIKENKMHKSITLKINNNGQEIKYTNNRLKEIVKQELKLGNSIIIK